MMKNLKDITISFRTGQIRSIITAICPNGHGQLVKNAGEEEIKLECYDLKEKQQKCKYCSEYHFDKDVVGFHCNYPVGQYQKDLGDF